MFVKRLLKLSNRLIAKPLVRQVFYTNMTNFNVIFVLGGPGAGKGTQCQSIVKEFGYTHLSAGDLLRAERNNKDSKVGALIDNHIKEGSIVPVKITCGLLEKAMQDILSTEGGRNNFLIDGFPRNQDNLQGWNEEMGSKTNLKFVLFFECDEQTCVDRCLSRGQGRADDNPDSLKKRFETYYKSTKPIIDHYEKLGLVRKIDATQPVEKVFEDVKKVFS